MTTAFDSESLQLLLDTGKEAAGAAQKVAVIPLPNEPKGVYGLIKADGSFEVRTAAAGPRSHKLLRLDQVPDFVKNITEKFKAVPTVWHCPDGVVILMNDGSMESDLQSRCCLPFKFTEQFAELQSCSKSQRWMDPRSFATWIRTKLMNVMRGADDLLMLLSKMKGSDGKTFNATNTKSRESIGLEVDAEMDSALGDLPDLILFDVRVYDDPSIVRKVQVTCALECNPRDFALRIEPTAGQLQDAIDKEMNSIGDLLAQELDCPVYYGVP